MNVPVSRSVAWLRRPQRIVAAALALVLLVSWWYLVYWPMPMPGVGGVGTLGYVTASAIMWIAMMVAMMAPAAAPVLLLFDMSVRRDRAAQGHRTLLFALGYVSVWTGFSLAATALQIALILAGQVDTMGVARSPLLISALLVAAGLYQFTTLKAECLTRCRSPVAVLTEGFRPGLAGAWRMGVAHGADCVGCCWALMLLLFVGGVMNLAWVAGLTLLVAIEKLGPGGPAIRRMSGIALLATGLALLLRAAA